MPNPKNKPDRPDEEVAKVLVMRENGQYEVLLTAFRRSLPKALGCHPDELAEKIESDVISHLHQEDERAANCERGSNRVSTQYSKAYVQNYDGIFGNKVGSDMSN